MLSRKYHKEIAFCISKSHIDKDLLHFESLVHLLSEFFEKDNPKFNRDKFKEACRGSLKWLI